MPEISNEWLIPATTWEAVVDRYVCYRQLRAWRSRTRRKTGELVPQLKTAKEADNLRTCLMRTINILGSRSPTCFPQPLPADIETIFSTLNEGTTRALKCRQIDIHDLWRAVLFNRDTYTCQYCHRSAWEMLAESRGERTLRFEIDHRLPRIDNSREFDASNLLTACLSCNRIKGQLTEEQFRQELRSLAVAVCRTVGV